MRKASIILLFILCLLIVGAIFYVFRLEQAKAPQPETTAAPTATATAVPTATPAPTSTAVPTVEPTSIPETASIQEPTAAPTAEPTATPTPTPTATPAPNYEKEGTFRSDTGAWLNLIVRWKLEEDGEKTTVHLEAYAESYSLMCTGADDVEFIIGNTSVKDSSGVINLENVGLTETLIGTADIEVERGKTADVFVIWTYKGTYGSPEGVKSLETIEADAEIYIP